MDFTILRCYEVQLHFPILDFLKALTSEVYVIDYWNHKVYKKKFSSFCFHSLTFYVEEEAEYQYEYPLDKFGVTWAFNRTDLHYD